MGLGGLRPLLIDVITQKTSNCFCQDSNKVNDKEEEPQLDFKQLLITTRHFFIVLEIDDIGEIGWRTLLMVLLYDCDLKIKMLLF